MSDLRVLDRVTAGGALLGESPRWDDRAGRLLWVDLWGGVLHATDPATGDTGRREVAPPLSAVVLSTRGTSVVTQGLCVLELAGDAGETPALRHLTDVPEDDCLRANDAAVDQAGRLWIGTMYLPGRVGATGSLWCWEPGDGGPRRVLDDLRLANGIGWSPDGTRMYVVDSLRQQVWAFSYDVSTGRLSEREVLAEIAPADGLPDGLAVAADGSVWVALAGGGQVRRYAADGELVGTHELPVRFPTSCAFGGADLTDLYVTSGSRQVPLEQRADAVAGGAGALFRVEAGVAGLPSHRVDLR